MIPVDLPFAFVATEELVQGHCSMVYADATRVLKLPFQGEELTTGFRATLLLQDFGGSKVLASDEDRGALLMERIVPGTGLHESSIPEPDRLALFIRIVESIRDVPTGGWMELGGYIRAHPLRDEMLATSTESVFLHGDLHHQNILLGPNGKWFVIDPKGLQGDPCFEASAWLRNPIWGLGEAQEMEALLDLRLEALNRHFGWDPVRMTMWAWLDLGYFEPETEDHPWVKLSRLLERRLKKWDAL